MPLPRMFSLNYEIRSVAKIRQGRFSVLAKQGRPQFSGFGSFELR